MVLKIAIGAVVLIGLVYVVFAFRRYASGDGRGPMEFIKLTTGTVVVLVLLWAGYKVFFG